MFLRPLLYISPLILSYLSYTLHAASQSTKEFQKFNSVYRTEIAKTLPQGSFQTSWAKSTDGWLVRLKGKKETIGGLIKDDNFSPLNIDELVGDFKKPEPKKRSRFSNNKKPFPKKEFPYQKLDQTNIIVGSSKYSTPEGWIWDKKHLVSPDGKWICVNQIKDVELRKVSYVRSSPTDALQPKQFEITYSKPGDELRDTIPVIFNDQKKLEINSSFIPAPYSVSKFHWRNDNKLWFEYIERGFGCYRLLEFDPTTKTTRIVAEEKSDKFVHVYNKCGWWDIGNDQLLWRSEADGWNHLYRINVKTGEREQLTSGKWVVREVDFIQDDNVYFQLSGYYPEQDPYYLHYARLNFKTGKLTLLTEGDGTHKISWSPDRKYYVTSYSRVDSPPVYELRRTSDAKPLAELWRYDSADKLSHSTYLPERFSTTDREGRYSIHGVIWKPKDFDPNKSYPILEQIYAGPHGAYTPKSWKTWYGARSEAAAAGFVVVQIDGRGTNYRGQEFQQFAYKNLRDTGFPDRIKWMKEAAKSRPWMDLSRVGIYGGSAGGQNALAALLWHGSFYKAAAADCGCHDNRMDKIWWNEQWLDWPVGKAYEENSNTEHISQLQGALFLTVGEVDTNVDPSSTYQVVDALIRADKDFEYFMIPNGGHGIGEKPYLRRRRIEFFQAKLGQETPR